MFLLVQNSIGRKAVTSIQNQFRQELEFSNYHYLSRALTDFNSTGDIRCTFLEMLTPDSKVILDLRYMSDNCNNFNFTLNGSYQNTVLKALNGDEYKLQFYTNNDYLFKIALWGARLVGIVVILLFFKILNLQKIKQDLVLKQEKDISATILLLSKQVAHDIRSPLSALNIITSTLTDVPEEKRLLIRNSVQRINDIANDLLQKGKSTSSTISGAINKIENTNNSGKSKGADLATKIKPSTMNNNILISTVIDNIISEKRIQFREKINIHIYADLKNSFGLFANANPNELSRVISNLVNNSVEALPNQSGNVDISVFGNSENKICIQIKDNGSGIPKHILAKLGQAGVTHGKDNSQSGSGLGVYHAIKTIQEFGGKIIFQSVTSEDLAAAKAVNSTNEANITKSEFNSNSLSKTGTTITIELPKADTPAWFAESIQLTSGQEFVTVDDDISIHQIWKGRLQSLKSNEQNIKLTSFTSAKEFREYFNKNLNSVYNSFSKSAVPNADLNSNSPCIFLIDYEFLNQNDNGLKIITDLGIQNKAILVTSRFDEPNIRSECEAQNIKILPKQLAGQIGISIMPNLDRNTFEITSQALPTESTDLEKSKDSLNISNSMYFKNTMMPIETSSLENTNLSKTESTIYNQPSLVKLSKYDLCLIDDDKLLVHSIWAMVAKEKGLNIKMFERPEDFLSEAIHIDKATPLYVDVSLANNVNGIDVAKDIHRLGFENINLATGYESESIKTPNFIRQVVGKDFPL